MAVTQQQLLFAELRDTFARRLTNHLNNVFVHQVTGRLQSYVTLLSNQLFQVVGYIGISLKAVCYFTSVPGTLNI